MGNTGAALAFNGFAFLALHSRTTLLDFVLVGTGVAPSADPDRTHRIEVMENSLKHGSWLNMAELELSTMARQCRRQRLPDQATMREAVTAWVDRRNPEIHTIKWQLTTEDARIKLHHLYPAFDARQTTSPMTGGRKRHATHHQAG